MPTLVLCKRPFSVDPWRIGVQYPDGQFVQLSQCHFRTKRDGLPFLRRLEALGIPWDQPQQGWTPTQQEGARRVLEDTPGYQEVMGLRKQTSW